MTALHYACVNGHLSIVEKLLSSGWDKEARDNVSVFVCNNICVYFIN